MATTPLRSSSVPAKRSPIDLSLQACGMEEGLKDLISDANLPAYAKLLIEFMMDMKRNFLDLAVQCKEIMAENKSLKEDNESLRRQLSVQVENEFTKTPRSNVDLGGSQANTDRPVAGPDLARSIVIAGMPEHQSPNCVGRANHDYHCVCSILNYLGIECLPSTVYRMGPSNPNKPKLVKVVLPASRFQRLAVQRAPRLRFFSQKGIYLRPSSTKEERECRRKERLANLSLSHGTHGSVARNSQLSKVIDVVDQSAEPISVSNCVQAGNL